ncbi:unnamed protein product [Mesocestoides corti]|uniref:Cilia- and flagella-associated protein 77 n=2 Tax=Mesocestoides corti TaxID=53468 RepID=A0A0R3U3Z8_MESCO|nr:unnamed protein product [Mesocestoides corti]
MPERPVDLGAILKSEFIAPGRMGYIRNSMFKRETLIRAPVGRHVTRGRSLPPSCFVYGMKNKWNPNAMNECMTWCNYKPVYDPQRFGVDYQKTNVESAKANIYRVPEWIAFRKEKDFHINPVEKKGERFKKPIFPVDMVFGRPPRPGTPFNCVISHYYKTEFDRKAIEDNVKFLTKMDIQRNKTPQPYDTLKSTSSVMPLPQQPKSGKLWTMKRFQGQPPRVSSYWDKERGRKLQEKMFEKHICDVQK